jgi:hypothetical protein
MMRLFLLLTTLLLALHANNWVERLNKNEIEVQTKKTPLSDVDSFRAITVVNAPLKQVLSLVEDHKQSSLWIKYCKEEEILAVINSSTWIKRTLTDMPWPLTDRDSISKNVKTISEDGKTVSIHFDSIANYYPVKKEFVRIELLSGYWKLESIDEYKTKVTYEVLTDPKNLPAVLVNSGVVEQPYETLRNLKNLLKKRK